MLYLTYPTECEVMVVKKSWRYKFTTVSDEEGRVWDIFATSLGIPTGFDESDKICIDVTSIQSYVVNYSKLRSLKNCNINFVPIKHISAISEIIEAMKDCLYIALSNFGIAFPGYEKLLISFDPNTNIREYINKDRYMQILLNQLVFDVLFDYFIENSEKRNVNNAANFVADVIFQKVKDDDAETVSRYKRILKTSSEDLWSFCDIVRKSMLAGQNAEKDRSEAIHIKNNIESMGLSPDKYAERLDVQKKHTYHQRKSLLQWIGYFINQRKPFVSSLQYRKQFKTEGNNISKKDFIDEMWKYNLFRELFNPQMQRNPKTTFESTMVYYYIETYKRIDFILYLLEKFQADESILHDIDSLESSYGVDNSIGLSRLIKLQTETPAAFVQRHVNTVMIISGLDSGCTKKDIINPHPSQHRSPIFLEKAILEYTLCNELKKRESQNPEGDLQYEDDDDFVYDYYPYYQHMESYILLRNKAYEIFSSNFTFGPGKEETSFTNAEYLEINDFIKKNYPLSDFHKEIKTWDTIEKLEEKIISQSRIDSLKTNSKNNAINLLKKRMMTLSSYLFPNLQS